MDSSHPEPLLIVVLGPTASGKTALSLTLAKRFGGEIVNCDSVAMYRELDIGTAKPTPSELARVPHHLFDCIDLVSHITAGEFARQARQVLEGIKARGHLPIIVGGTGLYLRALLDGFFPGPQRCEQLRGRLREKASRGSTYLHRILSRLDRAAADKIHVNDAHKLIRAIEVCLVSGEKMTERWQQSGRDQLRGFQILRIGLDPHRHLLYERINRRAQHMFEVGLVEETQCLLEKYGETAGPLSSLGYKQVVQFLRGEITHEQALATAQQAHRNYAKRQTTWFRREPDVHWLRGFGDDERIQQEAADCILGVLKPKT